MKNIIFKTSLVLTVIGVVFFAASGLNAAEAKKIKVLLITGDDVNVHPWQEVSSATRAALQETGKFDVKISEDAGILESMTTIQRYDVIYMAMYNATTPTLSDTAKNNLVNYIKGGKGFVVSHLSSASFKEWDEFKNICGRYWVMGKSGHGPRSVFKAKIANKEHPITKGMEDFEQDDELYAKLLGNEPITVLVTADSDWSKQTEPLAFIREYGKGRVFHHTFGHDGKAINNPAIKKIIARGTEWAAKGTVE
ncbi:MAG: ThuA domain-containing protein [Verrucomicrobiae bacterium]|nr:ThuA domain-containing protein [Verrucomicrobiae bacterium]